MATNKRKVAMLLVVLFMTACATLPEDSGRKGVETLIQERGLYVEETSDPESLVKAYVAKPLTAESAVRIALINNPRLKAEYARLGFAVADVYEAGRIRNPIFSAAFLDSNRAGERDQITLGLMTSFTDLITLSARKRLAAGEFAIMKQSIGAEVLNVAAETDAAFYRFVAAKQVAALRTQIARAGELSVELAKRYHQAGNLTALELALEQAAASETRLAALNAQGEAYRMRTELARLTGLSVAASWDSPAQLPLPLEQEDDLDELLALGRQSRLDLAAANTNADIAADRLGISNWKRWLGELDVGVETERETDGARLTGPTVDWEVPIFTQHRDSLLRARAELQIAIAEVERLNTDVTNSVRLAYAGAENAKARVIEYRDQLIPARIASVARAQEEENFMLIGIFELLATKQQEYNAYQGYLEAVRDYWLARAGLTRAVGNSLPSSAHIGKEYLDVDDYLRPKIHDKHPGRDAMHEHSMMAPDSKDDTETMPMDRTKHHMNGDQPTHDKAVPNNRIEHHDQNNTHGTHHNNDGGSR